MSDTPYSNREIEGLFKTIEYKLDAMNEAQEKRHSEQDQTLSSIETQTKKTNGRVNRLELVISCIIALMVGLGIKEVLSVLKILA